MSMRRGPPSTKQPAPSSPRWGEGDERQRDAASGSSPRLEQKNISLRQQGQGAVPTKTARTAPRASGSSSSAGSSPSGEKRACGVVRMVHAPPGVPLPGIVIEAGGFSLDRAWWGCCAGDGQRYDATTNTVTRCELTRRTHAAANLAHSWLKTLEGDTTQFEQLVRGIDPVLMARHGVRLMQTALHRANKGLAEPMVAGVGMTHSPLWVVALAAAWRYGVVPHVVDISAKGFASDAALLPKLSAPGTNPRPMRTVIFALGISKLWDPATAERFELLIDLAYRCKIPLWCEMALPEPGVAASPSPVAVRTTRQAFASRIEQLRREPPWRQLTAGSRARLAAVCDLTSLQALLRAEKSPS